MEENKMVQNRDAKGIVIERLMSIGDKKRRELIKQYKIDDEMPEVLKSRHAIFVGTWFNRTVKAVEKGCTEEELKNLIEHLVVVTNAGKYNLNITKSAIDHNMHEIIVKYCHGEPRIGIEQRIYADRQTQLEHTAKKKDVLKLKNEGKSNQEIAEELNLPESTVRFFLRTVE